MAQTYGIQGKLLSYIVRKEEAPEQFATSAEHQVYKIPLTEPGLKQDNNTVYNKLKPFLNQSDVYSWIQSQDITKNQWQAWLDFTSQ
jgi:hypothetical protein